MLALTHRAVAEAELVGAAAPGRIAEASDCHQHDDHHGIIHSCSREYCSEALVRSVIGIVPRSPQESQATSGHNNAFAGEPALFVELMSIMSNYFATIQWARGDAPFHDNKYSREHLWQFDGGLTIPASASPHIVPVPFSNPDNVDPEEAFVASLSSCHMLFFLSLCVKAGFLVNSYRDEATGVLAKNVDGLMVMTQVILRPKVAFSDNASPSLDQLNQLHHDAHEMCFLANSVKTVVAVEAQL